MSEDMADVAGESTLLDEPTTPQSSSEELTQVVFETNEHDDAASAVGGLSDDMTDSDVEAASGGSARARIAAIKEQIAAARREKATFLAEEDFIGAQQAKERIELLESKLQEVRRILDGAPQPPVGTEGAAVVDRAPSAPVSVTAAVAAATAEAVAEVARGNAQSGTTVDQPEEENNAEGQSNDGTAVTLAGAIEGSQAVWCEASAQHDEPLVQLIEEIGQKQPFLLSRDTQERLYAYQRQGVAWLARLYRKQQGGILADEMGLGKTVQVCAFLSGVRRAGACRALVLLPVTLLDQWAKEARLWCPEWPVHIYHGSAAARSRALASISSPQGGLLLTSYSLISTTDELFEVVEGKTAVGRHRRLKGVAGREALRRAVCKRAARKRFAAGCFLATVRPAGKRKRLGADDNAHDDAARDSAHDESNNVDNETTHVTTHTTMDTTMQTATHTTAQSTHEEANAAVVENVSESARETPVGASVASASVVLGGRSGAVAWDVVVCDEAHRMKNISSLFSKSLRRLRSRCRLLLTGTPVQNALQDLWALLDFAQPGLLGNHATFLKTFSDPIDRGSIRGASPFAVTLKRHLAEQLRSLIAPHVLRRTKATAGLLLSATDGSSVMEPALFEGDAPEAQQLPPKRESILWLLPSEEQVKAYRQVLEHSEIIREAVAKQKFGLEVLRAIGLLKRLCNHPLLVLPMKKEGAWQELLSEALDDERANLSLADEDAADAGDEAQLLAALGTTSAAVDDARAGRSAETFVGRLPRNAQAMLAQSAKLRCLALLVPGLVARGHRVLIFSQSLKMLDLVQVCVLRPHGVRCLRLDGLSDPGARLEKVEKFQTQRGRFPCMLLTTSVGGVGLNLTGADRVILVDPAWNPATDAQAVDRAYRIGQDKEVRVYRLVTSGLIEDKMFRLQCHKMGLTQVALDSGKQHSYFTAREIRALFEWTDPAQGETQRLLLEKHGAASQDAVRAAANADGAMEDGWLAESMAAGASDFGLVVRGFPKSTDSTEEAQEHVASARQRLAEAEQRAEQAAQVHRDAQARCGVAEKGLEETAQSLTASIATRAAAEELSKHRKAALAQASREHLHAQRTLERASRIATSAKEQMLRAVQCQQETDSAAQAAMRTAADTRESARSAEAQISALISRLESMVCQLRGGRSLEPGPATGSVAPHFDAVQAAPDKTRRLGVALQQVWKALDIASSRRADVDVACSELSALNNGRASTIEHSRPPSPLSEAAGADSTTTPRRREEAAAPDALGLTETSTPVKQRRLDSVPREASSPDCAKGRRVVTPCECQRLERAIAKAQQKAESAREGVSKAIATLVERGSDVCHSFTKDAKRPEVKAQVVKAATRDARAMFRKLAPTWQAAQRSQEALAKAADVQKRLALQALSAASAREKAEAEDREAERQAELSAAEEGGKRKAYEVKAARFSDAEAARHSAKLEEVSWRKKREEVGVEEAHAREAKRLAKAAERRACAERQALQAECSKVERSQQRMEEAKSSAMQKLRSEVYDVGQVQQAYEQRRRSLGGES